MRSLATSDSGDLLVEGDRIIEVRPHVDLGSGAAEAEIIDGPVALSFPG